MATGNIPRHVVLTGLPGETESLNYTNVVFIEVV